MTEYQLERENDVPLSFEGTELAHVSSREDDALRWTEIHLFRTSTGKYVVQQIGKTLMRNEVDRIKVNVVGTPKEVIRALRRKDEIEYLTHLALEALEEAAEVDQDIADSLVERI